MNQENVQLTTKGIGKDIEGIFYIPSYQRGYRWGDIQVKALLDDVYHFGENIKKKRYII